MKKFIISICSVLCFMLITTSSILCKPTYAENANAVVTTTAKASLLIDNASGEVLFENNSDAKVQVASIVKLMTALITLEKVDSGELKLDDKLQTSTNSAGMGGSQVFVDPYVEYTINEMLKSVVVASANDASVALAEHISGSEENFVTLMNNRAQQLGMTNTLYANCTGLPDSQQYSSAKDTAKVFKEVLKHKKYFDYSKIWMEDLIHPSGRKTELVNTNKLIRYYKGCDAGKTGFTDEAGHCLVASAERNNMRFIAVALASKGSQDRFNDVAALFNYGFANFENSKIVSADQPIKTVDVTMSMVDSIELFAQQEFYALNKKGEKVNYDVTYELPNNIKAPIKANEKIGKIIISKDGEIVEEISLIAKEDVDKITYGQSVKKIINNWSI